MSGKKTTGGFSALVAAIAIVVALVIGIAIYELILGNPANFIDGDPNGEPLHGNYLGIVYKGGFIVPILIAVNITVLIFVVERFVTLAKIKGKGNTEQFIDEVKAKLNTGDIAAAKNLCDEQKGSLGNVVYAGLHKYELMASETDLTKEAKIEAVKKELEEAITLEGPMLSKNIVVISTIASVSVLIGLIGTVIGMIKSFGAMSSGAPDTAALSAGISEALINTVLGIAGSCIAIIFFNLFNTKVDQMTHAMDEASFAIVADFSKNVK